MILGCLCASDDVRCGHIHRICVKITSKMLTLIPRSGKCRVPMVQGCLNPTLSEILTIMKAIGVLFVEQYID